MNNKQWAVSIQQVLKERGIAVELYNSELKQADHQLALQKTGMIAVRSLATSYLMEGINVLSPDIAVICIAKEYDIDNIRQAAARARRCYPIVILLLPAKIKDRIPVSYSPTVDYLTITSKIQMLADDLNEIGASIKVDKDQNRYDAIQNNLDLVDFKDDKYVPHKLKIKMLVK